MLAFLNRFFLLKEHQTTIKREVLAGATTFLTLAYALLVIPSILSEAGLDFGATLVATALVGAYSTFMMGVLANYPFVLAPGIALCVYFSYSVVLGAGHTWQTALGIVFLTGVILLILNLLRVRQLLIQVIPQSLRLATTAGMGVFLALIGLKNAGIIVAHPMTLIAFGDPKSVAHVMTAIGLISMGTMLTFRIPGALFLGILIVWILSLFFGVAHFGGFVSLPSSLMPTLFQLDVVDAFQPTHLGVLISFLFVGLFDSTGTLVGLAEEGGFLEECDPKTKKCRFPRVTRALMPDTTGTILSPLLGTTSVAVYLESAAGLSVGGRTGLTAVTAAFLFFTALFFAPFAGSIPLFATAPALIIIGGMMLRLIARLDWQDPSEWIPAFTTLILIPLTYSIANGIAVGYIMYCMIKLLSGRFKEVHWFSWILGVLFVLKFFFFPGS
ncbi:MAG: Adenine permease AdeP [Chlamydiales bacterium]|nr:Adenine permease AdeP [Chlamydiales bacterium]